MANPNSSNTSSSDDAQSLLTEKAFALALSPPRAPPFGTAHHDILLGKNPWQKCSQAATQLIVEQAHGHVPHDTLRDRMHLLLHRSHNSSNHNRHLAHPHLPTGPELGDRITRFLGVVLSVELLHGIRDGGYFRSLVDTIVTTSAPTLALTSPFAALAFVKLTANSQRVQYGSHERQYFDLYLPANHDVDDRQQKTTPERLVFFVHGGAWGSGLPWMYRLAALPFLQEGWAVAVVGYRTYPDGNVKIQVDDLELAAATLADRYPQLSRHVTVMGHSSGAHISLLMIVDRAKRRIKEAHDALTTSRGSASKNRLPTRDHPLSIDSFVGLSGPYDISHHFDYEAARGVEELSPMKPVCGYNRNAFRTNSPALRLQDCLADINECHVRSLDNFLPPMALMHGIEDDTVPFTATGEAARILRSCGVTKCQEIYLAATGHQDAVMHLMLGGRARDATMTWIKGLQVSNTFTPGKSQLLATSKL